MNGDGIPCYDVLNLKAMYHTMAQCKLKIPSSQVCYNLVLVIHAFIFDCIAYTFHFLHYLSNPHKQYHILILKTSCSACKYISHRARALNMHMVFF